MQKRNRPTLNLTVEPETKEKLEELTWKLRAKSKSEVVEIAIDRLIESMERKEEK